MVDPHCSPAPAMLERPLDCSSGRSWPIRRVRVSRRLCGSSPSTQSEHWRSAWYVGGHTAIVPHKINTFQSRRFGLSWGSRAARTSGRPRPALPEAPMQGETPHDRPSYGGTVPTSPVINASAANAGLTRRWAP